jgi:hypothetical protein
MTNRDEIFVHGYRIRKFHPLTEKPTRNESTFSENGPAPDIRPSPNKSGSQIAVHPNLNRLSPVLIKLLWDILCYPWSSISIRIKRLGSASALENAKLEGFEKGFIFESAAGATKYLIPTLKTFESFNMPCPYKRSASIEHSYYVGWGCFLLGKDPGYKTVQPEVKQGSSGSTSDIVTVAHNGTRLAWEVTLSTTNILANACKYINTDFVQVVFLCRDCKLREAVKACCREGSLDSDLLAKLDYMQFSTLLRRQRKLSLY